METTKKEFENALEWIKSIRTSYAAIPFWDTVEEALKEKIKNTK